MAEYTEKLNLKKPSPEDFYDIADFNANTDILEQEVGSLKDWKSTFKVWFLDTFLKVGTVIERGDDINPSTIYGGTWQPYAQGQTTVGLDQDDPDFNEVGKTGGSKTAKYSLEHDSYAKIGGYANQPVVLRYTNKKGAGIEYSADTHATFSQGAALGPIGEPYTQTRAMALGGTTDEGNNMPPYVVTRKWIRVA